MAWPLETFPKDPESDLGILTVSYSPPEAGSCWRIWFPPTSLVVTALQDLISINCMESLSPREQSSLYCNRTSRCLFYSCIPYVLCICADAFLMMAWHPWAHCTKHSCFLSHLSFTKPYTQLLLQFRQPVDGWLDECSSEGTCFLFHPCV